MLAFGQYVETRYDFTRADVVLSLDDELLDEFSAELKRIEASFE